MKTYQDHDYQYFYDSLIQLWTIYRIDSDGCQVGDADWCNNKKDLKKRYPELSFTPLLEN
jgi:hypothetical protein